MTQLQRNGSARGGIATGQGSKGKELSCEAVSVGTSLPRTSLPTRLALNDSPLTLPVLALPWPLGMQLGVRQLGGLQRHHIIRLPDQVLQLMVAQGIETVQHDPLVAPDVGRRMHVLPLDEFCKGLGSAFEAKLLGDGS